jgi:mannose-6-phosphate isomerase-like protein (cupin superfamily)
MTASGVIGATGVRSFPYGGQQLRVLAELPEFGLAEMVVPPGFGGPVPHIHHRFDEGIYVIEGELLLTVEHDDPVPAPAGSFCFAPRGTRHTFANPTDSPVRVLGIWSPGAVGLAFMADVGALVPPQGRPDPALVAAAYHRHASELLP